jgi:nicotinamidase/pyrazinamidase
LAKKYTIANSDALLITDIQKDFLPGGALPVAGGNEIIPVLNEYARRFEDSGAFVFASRDWHPPNHMSFKEQGGPWPSHCVQNTDGAQFSPDLKLPQDILVVSKAIDPKRESYSVFEGTNFEKELRTRGVKQLFVGGLATDYCVVNTVLDAVKFGFDAVVIMDATLGINVQPHDVDEAVAAMQEAGAQQMTMDDFPDEIDALPMGTAEADKLAQKPTGKAAVKKKARLRSRGSAKRLPTERKS